MLSRAALLAALAFEPASAAECPSWGKPFPSNLNGSGKVSHAEFFDVTYYGTYKVVEYASALSKYSAYHTDDALKGTQIPPVVLYECETTRPVQGDPGITSSDFRFFEIPIRNATVGTGVSLAFMELLGVTESVSLVDLEGVSSPCSQLMEHCVPGVHVDASNSAGSAWVNASQETQLVFTDSFGTGYGRDPAIDVPFQISLDPGTLHRAEWVKFMALFYNEEAQADNIFTQIESDYNALKALAVQQRTNTGRTPKVAWVTYSSGRGGSPDSMKINNAAYKEDVVTDAGGMMVPLPQEAPEHCSFGTNNDNTTTLTCTVPNGSAAFLQILAQADVIIDESSLWPHHDASQYPGFGTKYGFTADQVPALANHQVYRLDGYISDKVSVDGSSFSSAGMGWFDIQYAEPQQTLAGMIGAIWGDEWQFTSQCGMKYLRRAVDVNEQVVSSHLHCPLASQDGNHNCAEFHDHILTPQLCSTGAEFEALPTSAPTAAPTAAPTSAEVSSTFGVRAGLAGGLAALALL